MHSRTQRTHCSEVRQSPLALRLGHGTMQSCHTNSMPLAFQEIKYKYDSLDLCAKYEDG